MVATSIGLAVRGVPVVGVIYNPFMDQLVRLSFPYHKLILRRQYSAAKGKGAYLNQKTKLPFNSRPLASLGQALSVASQYSPVIEI